jgi:hypothetical protein
MARHDYSVRPEPRWEDGFFVPPSPVPMPKPAADWNLIDVLDNFRAMSRNPISGTTQVSITELDAQGKSLGISVFVATSPEAIRHIFIGRRHLAKSSPRACAGICPSQHRQLCAGHAIRDRRLSVDDLSRGRIR